VIIIINESKFFRWGSEDPHQFKYSFVIDYSPGDPTICAKHFKEIKKILKDKFPDIIFYKDKNKNLSFEFKNDAEDAFFLLWLTSVNYMIEIKN